MWSAAHSTGVNPVIRNDLNTRNDDHPIGPQQQVHLRQSLDAQYGSELFQGQQQGNDPGGVSGSLTHRCNRRYGDFVVNPSQGLTRQLRYELHRPRRHPAERLGWLGPGRLREVPPRHRRAEVRTLRPGAQFRVRCSVAWSSARTLGSGKDRRRARRSFVNLTNGPTRGRSRPVEPAHPTGVRRFSRQPELRHPRRRHALVPKTHQDIFDKQWTVNEKVSTAMRS